MALEFLKIFFGSGGSKNIAKERLQIVLIHDRADISPEMLEQLRRDMIDVITRYMDIDTSKIEMDFDRADRSVAFVANIPVIRIKRGMLPGKKEQEIPDGGKKTHPKRKPGKSG
ncbi:cell division topological specificity factor MinE [Aminivibrio sp.]|uniref:cell division topological specificity factor MinE n=1 Tax=Aminivibrio sp. TaxID=1872489 RepID=UPI001A542C6C|nr:cell division topological specificity factor MinE [Aminivibrio sp.]MBL3539108.1 cell division topological specificity factor MinE [Aminivibrio sp.]